MKRYLLLLVLTACGGNLPPPAPIPAEPNRSNIVAQTPPPPAQEALQLASISLCWDRSPDPIVTSYGVYQDGKQVDEVTDNKAAINGLVPGTLYSFFVTAKGKDDTGAVLESDPSNVLKYIIPILSIDTAGVHFTVPEPAYQVNVTYQLESTTDLANGPWVPETYTLTGTQAILPVDFSAPQKFYRVKLSFGNATCN